MVDKVKIAERMRKRGATDKEIERATCDHDYGKTWMHTPFGCTQTCRKCGQIVCNPRHCH